MLVVIISVKVIYSVYSSKISAKQVTSSMSWLVKITIYKFCFCVLSAGMSQRDRWLFGGTA